MKKLFVIMLAVVALVALAAPAFAAEPPGPSITINGRMLTDFGWWQKGKEITANQKDDVTTNFVNVPGHTYLRAKFTSPDKTTGGMIELGLKSLQPEASVSLRYAYGWYKVGNCRFVAGQTDNWFGSLAFHPKQYVGLNENAHLLLFGWGMLWPHRVPQVRMTWENGGFGVQFSLEEPRVKNFGGAGTDGYFSLPRMTLTGSFATKNFLTKPGVLFVRHETEGGTAGSDESYDTLAFVLPIKVTFGAFTAKFQGHYGKNLQTEIPFYPGYSGVMTFNGKVYDTTTLGGMLSVEYNVGAATVIAGIGYEDFKNDDWKNKLGYKDDSNTRKAYFVAVPYQINKYFGIHPEFSYYDYGENPQTGRDLGTEWILGLQFRFVF